MRVVMQGFPIHAVHPGDHTASCFSTAEQEKHKTGMPMKEEKQSESKLFHTSKISII